MATGLAAWVIARTVGHHVDLNTTTGQLEQVFAGVAGGIAVYAGAAVALRLSEARTLFGMIGSRGRRVPA